MIAQSADLKTLFDASKRSIDPTKTGGLRLRWRMAVEARLRSLTGLIRAAIIGQDILGLGKVSLASISFNGMQGGDRLRAWSTWITDAVYATLVGSDDGAWVGDHIGAAYNFGLQTAQRELLPAEIDPSKLDTSRLGVLQSLAQNELQGIADAAVQQITRAVAESIVQEHSPTKMYRLIIGVLERVATVRSRALVNMMVVKTFNEAKLDVYRAAGVTKIGTLAELLPPKKPGVAHDHAHTHARDAGFSGPGSRISREVSPSASTISRIFKAYQKLKELGSVEVLNAGDDDVCPECEDISFEGPYDIDEGEGLIPAHPNCRCSFVPVDDERFAEQQDSVPFITLKGFAGGVE